MKKIVLLLLPVSLVCFFGSAIAATDSPASMHQGEAASASLLANELVDIQERFGQSGRNIVYLRIDVLDCSMKRYRVVNGQGEPRLVFEEEYVVGTPKTRFYPKGKGIITNIEYRPWWYPTAETVAEFKKRGKHLEKFRDAQGKIAIPPGHRLNFMGPIKMKITFIDPQATAKLGRMVYRIHGNLDTTKLGTRCSGGCIRMDNHEIKMLAKNAKGKTIIIDYI